MPRDGTQNYVKPSPDVVTDTTIESAVYNLFVNDIVQELNTPLPVSRGGTGGTDPASAMTNLGGELFAQVVTNYDSFAFQPGSFHSLGSATASPVATHAFSGICYWTDANNMFIEATDQDDVKQPGGKWLRQKKGGLWSLWASLSASVIIADTAPTTGVADNSLYWESDSGTLYVRYNDGDSVQWVVAVPVPDLSVYVNKAGDTMTGPLVLPGNATLALQAVPKQQLDAVGTVAGGGVRYDVVQVLTEPQRVQARQNIYAAPFDALAFSGIQINGSCEVSQENGATGINVVNALKYVVDGWLFYCQGAQTISCQQIAGGPAGFANCINASTTVANAAPAAGNCAVFIQRIEGWRVARLAWGTPNAMPITFGFWVNAARAGNYSGTVSNGAGNRSYAFPFTINAAGTWEYKIVTVPGDTAGTWAKDNTVGLAIVFAMMAGASLQTTANIWTAGGFFGATGTINGIAATSDVMYITGLIVLPGIEAPSAARSPLIMRPYDQELLLCQRQLEILSTSSGAINQFLPSGQASAGNNYATWRFCVKKRALPTTQFLGAASWLNSVPTPYYALDEMLLYSATWFVGSGGSGIMADARL